MSVKLRSKDQVLSNEMQSKGVSHLSGWSRGIVVQSLSRIWLFVTPWTAACQASLSFTISQSLLKLMSIESVMPSNHLVLCCPLFLPSVFLASGPFLMSWLFASGGQSILVWASFLPMNIQDWFCLELTSFRTDWFPCSPGNSQESSPAPQFESLNSSVLSLLYGPALTFVHDYWKNHSFDYGPLLAKWCLCFLICYLGLS